MSEESKKLTLEQAFCAMFYFLESEYDLTNSDDIADLLGSLNWTVWNDTGPADPAAWEDWLDAVKKARDYKHKWT